MKQSCFRPGLALAVLLTWTGPAGVGAESTDAQDAVRAVMARFLRLNAADLLQSDEARAMLVGEAGTEWTGSNIGMKPGSVNRVTLLDDRRAAAAAVDAAGERERDVYFYLRFRDGEWKIGAMRTPERTEIMSYALEQAERSDARRLPDRAGAMMDNLRLNLSSDRQLARWFAEHRESLEELVRTVSDEVPADGSRVVNDFGFGTSRVDPDVAFPRTIRLLRALRAASVSRAPNGEQRVILGGVARETLSLLYSPGETPPRIDLLRHLWVEQLAPGWYLLRLT